jgi:hypothetical protein
LRRVLIPWLPASLRGGLSGLEESVLGWSGLEEEEEDEELLLELDDDELLLELPSPGNGNLSALGLELAGVVLLGAGAGASGASGADVVEGGGACGSPGKGNLSAAGVESTAGVQGFCALDLVLAGQGGGAEFWARRVGAAARNMAVRAI